MRETDVKPAEMAWFMRLYVSLVVIFYDLIVNYMYRDQIYEKTISISFINDFGKIG